MCARMPGLISLNQVRIVMALAYEDELVLVAIEAHGLGMMLGWAWLGVDAVFGAVYAAETSLLEQAKQAFSGWLYLRPAVVRSTAMDTFYGNVKEYNQKDFNISFPTVDPHAAALYDSVYLFAYAATLVLAEGGDVNDGAAMVAAMSQISFQVAQPAKCISTSL